MMDYHRLIPELRDWELHNGHPFSPSSWLSGVGSFEHAIAYGYLFWPEMLEHDGCIFVNEIPDEASYQNWLQSNENNKPSVEAVLNHVHILDLFPPGKTPPTSDQLVYIGGLMRDMWQAKANQQFPDRKVTVEFYESDSGQLVDHQLTLFQEHDV